MKYPLGTVLFAKSSAKSGKTIRDIQYRLFGRGFWYSELNHVAVLVGDDLVRNAAIPKSKLMRLPEFESKYEIVRVALPSRAITPIVGMWSRDQVKYSGQWYGVMNVLGIYLWWVLSLIGIRLPQVPLRSGRICTEDVAYAMQDYESAHAYYSSTLKLVDKNSLLPAAIGKYSEDSPFWLVGGPI